MSLSKRKLVIGLCSTVAIVSITLAGLNSSVETNRSSKMIEYANALCTDESTTTTEKTTVSTTTTNETTTSKSTMTKLTTTKPTTTTTSKSTTTTTSTTSTEATMRDTVLMVKYENAPVPEAVYTEFTEEITEPPVETDVEIVDEPEQTESETTETNTETETEVVISETETETETTPEPEPPANICPVTGYELLYSATYNVTSNPLTRSMGVIQNFNGHRETWYSERVLPGYGLKIPGRHCGDDGTVRDENGYICVASDLSYLSRGSIVLTSRGPGKVYDTGCAYGTIDIYVNW